VLAAFSVDCLNLPCKEEEEEEDRHKETNKDMKV
jgi:hypothetical protein